jgi:hypothetical protein
MEIFFLILFLGYFIFNISTLMVEWRITELSFGRAVLWFLFGAYIKAVDNIRWFLGK